MGLNEGIVDSNNLNVVVLNTVGLSEDEASESEGHTMYSRISEDLGSKLAWGMRIIAI